MQQLLDTTTPFSTKHAISILSEHPDVQFYTARLETRLSVVRGEIRCTTSDRQAYKALLVNEKNWYQYRELTTFTQLLAYPAPFIARSPHLSGHPGWTEQLFTLSDFLEFIGKRFMTPEVCEILEEGKFYI